MKYGTVIPARGGSKGIPRKNLQLIQEFPLIFFSIDIAKNAFGQSWVSSDDDEILTVASTFLSQTIKRPSELAQDDSGDIDWIKHALGELDAENIVILRPTTPFRCVGTLLEALAHFEKHNECTGMRSAHKMNESPYKMVVKDGDYWKPFMDVPVKDLDKPRQSFTDVFQPNGYIDIVKRSTVDGGSLFGDKMLAFETPWALEIDSMPDLEQARLMAESMRRPIFENALRCQNGGVW